VHKWRSGRGVKLARVAIAASAPTAPTAPLRAAPEFVAIEMPDALKPPVHAVAEPVDAAPIAEAPIQIELRRGPLHLNVRWPASAADACSAWLRELSSGLLK
jgi:hypothetical protein